MKFLAPVLLAGAIVSQTPVHPHLVLTRLAGGNPTAQLLDVDRTTGAVQPLGRFASDVLVPLAVAIDPCDGSPLVALDAGGPSRIVRLVRSSGGGFVEYHVANLPGPVSGMVLQQDDLLAAVDGPAGGIFKLPPRGGVPVLLHAQPNATSVFSPSQNNTSFVLAWTGRAGTNAVDSGVAIGLTATGAFWFGPHTFANPSARDLTGAFLMAAFPPQYFLSFDDGTFATFVGSSGLPPQPLTTIPVIPTGGAVAMQLPPAQAGPLMLGGAPFPCLYDVDVVTGAVAVRSAVLPGTPVDFAAGLWSLAHWVQCQTRCGPTPLTLGLSGLMPPPTTLTMTVSGPANGNDYAMVVVGLDYFAGGSLPIGLPGGCLLHVSPDAVTLHQLGPSASQNLAIPGGPAFLGKILFAQWVHFGAPAISVSGTIAFWIGL